MHLWFVWWGWVSGGVWSSSEGLLDTTVVLKVHIMILTSKHCAFYLYIARYACPVSRWLLQQVIGGVLGWNGWSTVLEGPALEPPIFILGPRGLGSIVWTPKEQCGILAFMFQALAATTPLTCLQVLCSFDCELKIQLLLWLAIQSHPLSTKLFFIFHSDLAHLYKALPRLQFCLSFRVKWCCTNTLENPTLFCLIIL